MQAKKTRQNAEYDQIAKGVGFQRGVYAFCRTFIGPVVNILFHIRYKPCKIQSKTFLALGNHTQNLDPAFLVIGTRRHMRFVANASLTKGLAGFFLNPFFGIIPREKGAKGDAAIAAIEANLRAGVSVGMFPEGNRSWDGETEFISPRTARMAKESGAALVTYRITGGYLLRPRWAEHKRRGPMRGELVHEYTPEELASMSEEGIYQAICRDLHVNAYEVQAAHGDLYKGKALAEGLQYAARRPAIRSLSLPSMPPLRHDTDFRQRNSLRLRAFGTLSGNRMVRKRVSDAFRQLCPMEPLPKTMDERTCHRTPAASRPTLGRG